MTARRSNAGSADARSALDNAISEKEFLQQIKDLARLRGWYTYHHFDSRRSDPGFPDLMILQPNDGRLLFLEVKSEQGPVTPAQQRTIDALKRVRVTSAWVVRPSDWEIVKRSL